MNHFTDIIGNVLNMELQRQLLPRVNAKMDQLQAQMQVEIVQKLSGFDKAVKENIAQVCKSKVCISRFPDLSDELLSVQTRKEEMRLKLEGLSAGDSTGRTSSSISAPVTANVTGGSSGSAGPAYTNV